MKRKMPELLVSLISLALLTGCGGAGPDPIDYEVTPEEFDSLTSMEGVEYAQVSYVREMTSEGGTTRQETIYESSPTVCHINSLQTNGGNENYVLKDGDFYFKFEEVEEDVFVKEDASEVNFITPQKYPFNIRTEIPQSLDEYEYDSKIHKYFATTTKVGIEVTSNLYFENKKLVNVKISTSDPQGLLSTCDTYTYTYKNQTPKLPKEDSRCVTEDQFKAACSFEEVTYLQVNKKVTSDTSEVNTTYECSDNVSRTLTEGVSPEITYFECFVEEDDSSYESALRHDDKDYYKFEEVDENKFVTPQSDYINVSTIITGAGLSYDDFEYNKNDGTFVASTDENGVTKTFTLKFNNNKLISFDQLSSDSHTTITYEYDEKSPSFPAKDEHKVTRQQFEDACSFKDATFVQTEEISHNVLTTINTKLEFSDTVYHIEKNTNTGLFSSYEETFVRKNDDSTYDKASRTSNVSSYIFEKDVSSTEFIVPQSDSFNVLHILEERGLSYDSFVFDDFNKCYQINGLLNNVTLKFENGKLISFYLKSDSLNYVSKSYTYNNTTPVFPS